MNGLETPVHFQLALRFLIFLAFEGFSAKLFGHVNLRFVPRAAKSQ